MAQVSDLRVESFHLNVGAGDGSIHLLTCAPAPGAQDIRRVIRQAFFIDGGIAGSLQSIITLINWIDTNFRSIHVNGNNAPYLKFDGFVVSHWDGDHFRGIEDFMMRDRVAVAPGVVQMSRALYDPITRDPLSFFYCPSERSNKSRFTWPNMILKARANERLAVVRQGEWLRGRNFFRQHAEGVNNPVAQPNQVNDFGALVNVGGNPVQDPDGLQVPANEAKPALYCVAADRMVLGLGMEVLTTPTNMSSLVLLIVWELNGNHRISHYLAGDAHTELENAVAFWIQPTYNRRPLYDPAYQYVPTTQPVTSMKLSHHGASTSNPWTLYDQFNSENVIASAGTRHKHPTWECILNLRMDFFLKQQGGKHFLPCRWPYWLVQGNTVELNLGALQLRTMTYAQGNAIVNHQRVLGGNLVVLRDVFTVLHGLTSNQTQLMLRQIIRDCMPDMSYMTATGLTCLVVQVGGNGVVRTNLPNILAIQITSAPNHFDGSSAAVWNNGANGTTSSAIAQGLSCSSKRIDGGTAPESTSASMAMQQDVALNSSRALLAAKTITDDNGSKGTPIDMYPNKGYDQPRIIDLTKGNPDWGKMKVNHEVTMSWYAKQGSEVLEEEKDDWSDIDDSLSITSFDSRTSGTLHSAMVQFQEIPADILPLAAEVYLTCQDEKNPTIPVKLPEKSTPCILDPKNPLSGFLNTLHFQALGLASTPDKVHNTPIHTDDEVYKWLGQFCGWATTKEEVKPPPGFSLGLRKVSEWPITDLVGTRLDFVMTVPYLSGTHLRFSTDVGAKSTFAKTYGPDAPAADGKNWGVTVQALQDMQVNRRTLIFGLEDLDNPLVTNLADVATFMRVKMLSNPLLQFLTDGLPLTLKTSEDFHNAIWFRPSMSYETCMRLQFHAETEKFNEWLHTLSPSLNMDIIRVIAKKKGSWEWVVPKDQMSFTSSITFLCRMTISSTLKLEGAIELKDDSVSLSLTLMAPSKSKSLQTMRGDESVLDALISWLVQNFQMSPSSKSELSDLLKTATKSETGVMSNDSILPRRIQIDLGLNPKGKITGVKEIRVDIETCLTVGRTTAAVNKKIPIVFLFNIGWNKSAGLFLRGKLWTVVPPTPFSHYDRALPDYEEHEALIPMSPVDPENQLRTIDIARLVSETNNDGEIKNYPAGIPNEIFLCEISISRNNVAFEGLMRCSPPQPLAGKPGDPKPPPPVPPAISLEMVELKASYSWGTKKPQEDGFSLELAITVDLLLGGGLKEGENEDDQYNNAAKLTGMVKYDKGDWTIEAAVQDLSILHLLQFWDLDDRGPISDFLGKINIDFIKILYEYKNGQSATGTPIEDGKDVRSPSLLKIEGQFTFANVATLEFEYINEGGQEWSLTGGLGKSEKIKESATIGGLLSGFMDGAIVKILPEAIQHATIGGSNGEKPLRLLIAKSQGISVFALLVQVEKVSVWFIQLREGPRGAVKRIIKASISKISVDVSAIQTTINSPWEELFFMWAQDQTVPKEGVNALTGITQKEFEAMSAVMKERLEIKDEQLMLFKPAAKKEPEDKPRAQIQLRVPPTAAGGYEKGGEGGDDEAAKKVVIAAGGHLVIVAKKPGGGGTPGVILDYLFGQKKKSAAGARYGVSNTLVPWDTTPGREPDSSGSEKGTKAPFKIKIGPLSVSNIGLWFKNGMFGINLDASLIMGPLGLSLLGFSIGVPFSKDFSLSKPPSPGDIEWGLKGLVLAMDKPPLTIAGGFMRDTSNPDIKVMYTGGLIVGFKPWSFEAMGAYATVYKTKTKSGAWVTTIDTRPLSQFSLLTLEDQIENDSAMEVSKGDEDRPTFTFAFIYVKMNGPLFSVGFADFAGLVGGFGINSDITLPTVEQVTRFPFVAERDDGEDASPVKRMQDLMDGTWFRPAEGLYWAAAGARVTAFQMLAANIVLVLQFGNGNLLFGIFGVATCDVPALEAPVKFAHVELGIVCTFDVNSGIFKFEAQMSPRSFVLAPQCHLTGGMALFSWLKGDAKDPDNRISAGDWVLTIGGYHRAFRPPKQYPKPPRLGISWSLSSCLSVKGEAYFAITPKVCMGGGKIRAALSIGVLYAWFDAFMDFLMNFEPFFFQMTARVSVGVRFTLDLWLVTIRISVEISAGLDLQGPPFGGVVHVDFWVFGFDIKFGASPKAPPAIALDRFFAIATKTGSSSGPSSRRFLTNGDETKKPAKPQADTAAIILTCETGLLPPLQDAEPKPAIPVKPKIDDAEDDKWYVKGASFSLMASFQFPVTSARLTERRTQKGKDGKEQEETRYTDCIIEEKYKEVYAKPMQLLTALDSAVAISVKSPEPRIASEQQVHVLKDWKDQKWKLASQVKPVQSSIWGKYDKNEDPALVKGPIQGLLKGDGATMQLITGISILPPDPVMAGDLVNKFNITQDHMSSVFHPQSPRWALFIGVSTDQEKAWAPKERGTCWKDLKNEWDKVGDATTTKVVDLWAKRMRYDQASVEGDQKDEALKGKFKPLRGIAPRKLLNNYSQLVPALPLVAVGQSKGPKT